MELAFDGAALSLGLSLLKYTNS